MSRAVGLLVLLLALLQGSGATALFAEAGCDDSHHHADDEPESDCPPECAACACGARVSPLPLLATAGLFAPTPAPAPGSEIPESLHEDPAPRGILHVPRPAIA